MALPANIRVNVRAPFPVRVVGSGLITVTKANGIWTIGLQPGAIVDPKPAAASVVGFRAGVEMPRRA